MWLYKVEAIHDLYFVCVNWTSNTGQDPVNDNDILEISLNIAYKINPYSFLITFLTRT